MRYRPPRRDNDEKTVKTDMAWLRAALVFGATMSKDPDRKVGACVVSPDNMRVSFGYNGFPVGVPDTPGNWADKELKNAMVQHAELNALAKAPFDVTGATAYVTLGPCHHCLGVMVNAWVDRVVWLIEPGTVHGEHWKYFNSEAFTLIRASSGIHCVMYPITDVERQLLDAITNGGAR